MTLEVSRELILRGYGRILQEIVSECWDLCLPQERREFLKKLFGGNFDDIPDILRFKEESTLSDSLDNWIEAAVNSEFDEMPECLWPYIIMAYDKEEFFPETLRERLVWTYNIVPGGQACQAVPAHQ